MSIENLFEQNFTLSKIISLDKELTAQHNKNCSENSHLNNIELKDLILTATENYSAFETNEVNEFQLEEENQWDFPRPCENNDYDIISSLTIHENFMATQYKEEIEDKIASNEGVAMVNSKTSSRTLNSQRKIVQKRKLNGSKTNKKHNESDQEKSPENIKPKTKPIKRRGRKSNAYKFSMISKEIKREKNQTKNTVKNYGKELIKFVHENKDMVESVIANFSVPTTFQQIDEKLQSKKKNNSMSKMDDLRGLWNNEKFGKLMRIISQNFFRQHCYTWVFNSRIQDFKSTLKYKARLEQFLIEPDRIQNLKWN